MSLKAMQTAFTEDLARLIVWANEQPGYSVRIDQVKRTIDQQILYYFGVTVNVLRGEFPILAEGRKRSNALGWSSPHVERRAGDLLLDVDGKYQMKTEAYAALGEYWESLHPNNVWGGRFKDGNHFERGYNART